VAIAIACKAILRGSDARFVTAAHLLDELSSASREGGLREALSAYAHPGVLVVAEVGYLSFGPDAADGLFQVVNERYPHRRPMVFTTNRPIEASGKELHDRGLAEAILDRVLERGNVLHFKRMKETVAFRKKWAGWWILRTNTDLPAEEVARQYLQLARTEELHAVVKGPLSIRPLHHRLERRVGAHLLVCHLAALVVRCVDRCGKEAGLKDREGEPLTGVSAIQTFRKVKASEVELPGTGQMRIVVTKLKPPQEAILKAVGVDAEKFREGRTRLL